MGDTCKSCGAAIIWAETKNGTAQPLDAVPSPVGNIRLIAPNDPREPIIAQVIATSEARRAVYAAGVDLYMPHHATCPNADEWRKR